MTEYVLVPREPTPEMLRAYWDAGMRDHDNDGTVRLTWAAMLAAAPVRATGGELRQIADELERAWHGAGPLDLDGFADRIRAIAALSPAIAPAGLWESERAALDRVTASFGSDAVPLNDVVTVCAALGRLAAPQDGEAVRDTFSAIARAAPTLAELQADLEADQPVGDGVLWQGWLHNRKGEDGAEEGEDFDLYDLAGNPNAPCPKCVRVNIVAEAAK